MSIALCDALRASVASAACLGVSRAGPDRLDPASDSDEEDVSMLAVQPLLPSLAGRGFPPSELDWDGGYVGGGSETHCLGGGGMTAIMEAPEAPIILGPVSCEMWWPTSVG